MEDIPSIVKGSAEADDCFRSGFHHGFRLSFPFDKQRVMKGLKSYYAKAA